MRAAHEKRPVTEFPRPPGVTSVRIDPSTGLRAYDGESDAIDEVFLEGTEPQEFSSPDAGVSPEGGLTTLVTPTTPTTEVPDDDRDAGVTVPIAVPASDGGVLNATAEDPPPF